MINYPSNTSGSCNNKTGCPTTSYCPDFQIKRFDTKPSFKVSLVDCKGPLNIHGLIAEANMWAEAKLKSALTAGTQATGTVTIVEEANLVATTHYITITTTDGTVITATVTANGGATTTTNTNSPTWAIVDASEASTAVNLATCLNANSKLIATASNGVVTITQLASGTAGNAAIALTDPAAGMSKVDFTGGVDPSLSLSLADNIGFEQVMVGDVIIMERARRPEHMLVKAFDETNSLISVQRSYNDTEAFAWKKGSKLKIFRVLNSSADVELVFEDVIQVDGTSKSTLVEADVLYDWKANDTCLSGCYLFEFKLIKMQEILYFLQGGSWAGETHQVSGVYYTGTSATDSSVPLSYDPETGTFLLPSTQWTGDNHVVDPDYKTGTSENDGSVVLNTTGVESDNSVVYGQAFTDSSFAVTDFGCGLSDGVEWVRSYPKNKEGFFVEITSSPISENY